MGYYTYSYCVYGFASLGRPVRVPALVLVLDGPLKRDSGSRLRNGQTQAQVRVTHRINSDDLLSAVSEYRHSGVLETYSKRSHRTRTVNAQGSIP